MYQKFNHSAFQVDAKSPKDAFLKVLNDEDGLVQLGIEYSHTLSPNPYPEQVMWEVRNEDGSDFKRFIDVEGTSETD